MKGTVVNVVEANAPCVRGSAGLRTQMPGQGATVSNFTKIAEKDRK